MRWIRAAVRAGLAVLMLFVVPPVVLVRVSAAVFPRRLPSPAQLQAWAADPLQPQRLAAALLVCGWLLWLLVAASALAGLAARCTRLARRCQLHTPIQGLTATLVGAAAVSTVTGTAADATPARPDGVAAGSWGDTTAARPELRSAAASWQPVAGPSADTTGTVTVRRDDTLFGIARTRLGDGNRWPELFDLNRGTHYRNGGTLSDPDLIRPGWTLRLPRHARSTGDRTPGRRPSTPHTTRSASPPPPRSSASPYGGGCASASASTTAPASPRDGDDGVVEPGPVATPPPRSSRDGDGPAPRPSGPPASSPSRPGVTLPSGSWLEAGLVTAVLAAAALVWAQRRRRYVRRAPSTQLRLDQPDAAPLPEVITQLRRGQRHATAADLTPTAAGTGSQEAAGAAGAPTVDDLTQLGNAHPAVADHRAQAADPGHRDDTAVSAGAATSTGDTLDTGRLPACLALTGAGAPAAARGLLVAALATGSDPDPHARAGVVTAATTVDRLLDHADVPALPGLTVVDDVATGLDLLDQHALRRARLLDDHDTDTLTALRTADPGEPLPPIILITDRVDVGQRGRLEALLTVGAQLDVHTVVLGAAVGGTPLEVAADGTTTGDPTPPANGPPGGTGRVTVMAAAEAYTSARRRASESCMRQATTTSQIIHARLKT